MNESILQADILWVRNISGIKVMYFYRESDSSLIDLFYKTWFHFVEVRQTFA